MNLKSQFDDFKQRLVNRKAKIQVHMNEFIISDEQSLFEKSINCIEQSLLIKSSVLEINDRKQNSCLSVKIRENEDRNNQKNENFKQSQFILNNSSNKRNRLSFENDDPEDYSDLSFDKEFEIQREEGMKELIINENNLMDMSDERIQFMEPLKDQMMTSLVDKEDYTECKSINRHKKISELEMEDIPVNYLSHQIIDNNIEIIDKSMQVNNMLIDPLEISKDELSFERQNKVNRNKLKCSELILNKFEDFNHNSDSDGLSCDNIYQSTNTIDLDVKNLVIDIKIDNVKSTCNTNKSSDNIFKKINDEENDIFISTIGNHNLLNSSSLNKHENDQANQYYDPNKNINIQNNQIQYNSHSNKIILKNSKFDKT